MTLVEKILELKGSHSYQWLADELQISKSHVYPCLIKGRPMGTKFLAAVLQKWPELNNLVLKYIAEKGTTFSLQERNNGTGDLELKHAQTVETGIREKGAPKRQAQKAVT